MQAWEKYMPKECAFEKENIETHERFFLSYLKFVGHWVLLISKSVTKSLV